MERPPDLPDIPNPHPISLYGYLDMMGIPREEEGKSERAIRAYAHWAYFLSPPKTTTLDELGYTEVKTAYGVMYVPPGDKEKYEKP